MFATRADTGQQEYTVNNAVNQAAKLKLIIHTSLH
jgi:hypothetical protein